MMISFRLTEEGSFHRFREQITVEEMLSRQYVRFCPTDAWRPNVNVYENAAAIIVCVDLAGMRPDAIGVDVTPNALVIRGQRIAPVPQEAAGELGVHLMEIDAGMFCRELELPSPVDRDRVQAGYRDGLLWITLPKAQ